ncbi:MAG TPA: glycosyltransferase [Thermoanaerobaculia bacterium]|nr:glycosyltransferase [Thermoanaerobaculia bacterium]
MNAEKVYLSTVTPVFRGAAYLRQLVAELETVRAGLAQRDIPLELLEAIFVSDGASDDSDEVLAELTAKYSWVRVVHLSRNFGQHPATIGGILHSSGDWVATLDEDLQHHPRFLIPLLARAVAGNEDVVYASAIKVHRSWFRNSSSRLYKALISRLVGNPQIRKFNSFRMLRGSIARAAAAVAAPDSYFDVVLCWFTNRLDALPLPLVDIRSQTRAPSSYDLSSLLRHARRMLISSQIKPLRLGALVGTLALATSIVLSVVTLVLKLLYPERIEVRGWTSLMLVSAFFGGLISVLVVIILEYMSTLLTQAQGKPTFFVVDRSKDRLLHDLLGQQDPG